MATTHTTKKEITKQS